MAILGVNSVGFDLDGTLYKSTPQMDNRIRNTIAGFILQRRPELGTVAVARRLFEDKYSELGTGGAVLRDLGFPDYDAIIEASLASADISDLIKPNPVLVKTLKAFKERKEIYLLTSSTKKEGVGKLECIGLSLDIFDFAIFRDTPGAGSKSEGSAFNYALLKSQFPARNHLYVGDRCKPDVLPAKALGMRTVATWKRIHEADYFISHINKIGELLRD